ncbi:putative polysaccharide deacetylase yxkH [Fibrella aestuarina BUZ 2]|uniref:Putative polysaccharide deacetylase yxkH n=1 Tax=Fibrella aestuarina BUZ 2 TaxID=1166018 RepID=I0KBQ2_9BACT|nr:polysaccharide deacetylase family protein [Fibrella aestuarina]CCH01555.1 putative polysaccharide deacetylase yxkH [Fibrella aestuarina BUZ 2]
MYKPVLTALLLATFALGCNVKSKNVEDDKTASAPTTTTVTAEGDAAAKADAKTDEATAAPATDAANIPAGKIADAATILSRKQVPILCYHQIREWRGSDSKSAKDYICPTTVFAQHMQMLADSGYHAITADQLYAYLTTGAALPEKPVFLTFDDGDLDQYENALPILNKHGFKAMFGIMTVAIGRRGKQPYMDKTQIKDLADKGHEVSCHTWDHHNAKKYTAADWTTQAVEPKKKLEDITGKPVKYFVYPFGLWNHEAAAELQKLGYLASFQLSEKKRDEQYPLQSVRRIIASGYWSAKTLRNSMVGSFKG